MRRFTTVIISALSTIIPINVAAADSASLIDKTVMIECGDSSGAGFYVDERHILTAKHVVEECRKAKIFSNSGNSTTASDFFFDPNLDIAVLTAAKNIAAPASLDETRIETGQSVYIVGAPIDGLVMSKGKVVDSSGTESPSRLYLEIPADNGNSGGPVFSEKGLIGMVTAKYEDGEVIAYNLKSVLRTLELSRGSSGSNSVSPTPNNSALPALQLSLIANIAALIIIVVLAARLKKKKQIVITLD